MFLQCDCHSLSCCDLVWNPTWTPVSSRCAHVGDIYS